MMDSYEVTPAFLEYLDADRPGGVAALGLEAGESLPLHRADGTTRCRLDLPGRDYRSPYVDRQVDIQVACVVLDDHPDVLATPQKIAYLRRHAVPEFQSGEIVKGAEGMYKVVARIAYMARLVPVDGGDEKMIDVDEARLWKQFRLIRRSAEPRRPRRRPTDD